MIVPLLRSSKYGETITPPQGFERVPPLQGFFLSIDVNTMILWVHYRRIFLCGLVSPLQGSFLSIDVNTMILLVHYRRIFFGDCFASLGALSEWGVKIGMDVIVRLVCVVVVRGFAFVGKVPPLRGSINMFQ